MHFTAELEVYWLLVTYLLVTPLIDLLETSKFTNMQLCILHAQINNYFNNIQSILHLVALFQHQFSLLCLVFVHSAFL